MAHVISFRCPSLIIRRTGLPYESTMAWILVLAPPRLWPISVGGSLFLHQRCADAPGQWNHPWKVPPAQHQGSGHRRYYPGCHPLYPFAEAAVNSLPWAITLWQVAPWSTTASDPHHSVDNGTVIFSWAALFTSILRRKQINDAVSFIIR